MSVVFDGVTCFPVGNANVNLVNGKLEISNIGSSGIDGLLLLIPTSGSTGNNIEIEKDYIKLNAGGELKCTTTLINKDGIISTNSENILFLDSNSNKVVTAWNTLFLPESFDIFGKKDGDIVFDEEIDNPQSLPAGDIALWVGIIGGLFKIGETIWNWIFGSSTPPPVTKTVKRHEFRHDSVTNNWVYIYEESEDPVAIDVEVIGGQTFNIDTW